MSGLQNKNLIFYSTYPHDQVSRQCIQEINKNQKLNKQFIRICLHHPQNCNLPPIVPLPKIIKQLKEKNLIPVIVASGFSKPILAQEALTWIQDTAVKEINGGVEACNINNGISENCSTIAQAELLGSDEFFNTMYIYGVCRW